jgi:hypothetical protein
VEAICFLASSLLLKASCVSFQHFSTQLSFVKIPGDHAKRDFIFLANMTGPVLPFFFDFVQMVQLTTLRTERNFGVRLGLSFRTAKEGIGRAGQPLRWYKY